MCLPELGASTQFAEAEFCTEFNECVSDIGFWENIDEPISEYLLRMIPI